MLNSKKLTYRDYRFNYRESYFELDEDLNYSIIDTLFVTYETVLINFQKEYKRRSLVVRYDDNFADTVRIVQSETISLTSESIFGKGIQRSGSITRGFSVGTTKDFTLSSGLRLQLSGKLSDDIEIVAALTDENTPIQPEGNTERLEELDKVFIEVRHQNVVGTFGDYDLNERLGEFGNINRKLQGLKGEFNFENYSGGVSLAGSRGKFNTAQIAGQDGNQGPYRLYGADNERFITIIAGSEKVYLDGNELKRGQNNDYTIEYSNSEITFTNKQLITSASRITVDYEYTDRNFKRNFFGANLKTKFFDGKLNIKFNYYREGDDESSPIDISISDENKVILENAGDDRTKAVTSGVSLAEPDSLGNVVGIYTRIDTTINGLDLTFYDYKPGDINSIYNVTFSFVGEGEGDYHKESLGHYYFVGIGQGSYLPIKYLPLPELRQMGNILIEAEPFENVRVDLEFAASLWDKNKFSTQNDNDNFGYARNISINIEPHEIIIGKVNLGKLGLRFRDRYIQDKFTSLDRINDIEFERQYNIQSNLNADEELREIGLSLQPFEQLNIFSKYGYLKKGENFESNRYLTNLKLRDENIYSVIYDLDYVKTSRANLSTDWLRQNANAFIIIDKFKPGVDFLSENKDDTFNSGDSLLTTSLNYLEIGPYFEIINLSGINLRAKYSYREESYPINGVMEKESEAATKNINLSYRGIKEINTSLDLTFRNKKYTEAFRNLGFTDNETVLIRSQSKFNFWKKFISGDIYYEAATEKTARLEKVFIPVPQGTGNYIYLGDLNNNGIAEENEFEPTVYDGDFIVTTIPTDELFPVINLKANTRWGIDFSKFINNGSLLSKILTPVSTETLFRLEEKSKEPDTKKIYLLNSDYFLNDSTTIYGSNLFQQDIHLFKNKSDISFRFRYTQRKSLNQFSGGLERGFYRERSLRIKFKMVKEINNQTEYINIADNVLAPATSNRARMVTNDEINTDFSYRPVRNIEVGFKVKVGRSQDDRPSEPTIINSNSQLLHVNISFAGKGRIRIELERNELNANTSSNYIPFEITRGNGIGKNYYWRFNFDYRVASNLQTSVSYDGRYRGAGKVVHTMRAEARAYF
ncbi:hypothetical protein ACFLR4_03895 [Bacteroidota bacterium]